MLDSDFYRFSSSSSASPLPFYSENVDPAGSFDQPHRQRGSRAPAGKRSRKISLQDALRGRYTVSEIRDAVLQLGVDPQRDPAASRLIFEHLLSHSSEEEIVIFLNDISLNIPGAGNYLSAVKDLDLRDTGLTEPLLLWDTVVRALELGLIPADELAAIVKTLPNQVGENNNTGVLVALYQEMWDAIGQCDVYGHKDLDEVIADAWLESLMDRNYPDALLLATDIFVATHKRNPSLGSWIPLLITQRLETSTNNADIKFVSNLLGQFARDVRLQHILEVTEFLVSSKKRHVLEKWQDCLSALQNARKILSSQVWTDIRTTAEHTGSMQFTAHHQIILRLWVLRSLSGSLRDRPSWKSGPRPTDYVAYNLLEIYEATRQGIDTEGFMASLRKGIHDLGLPFNGLLMLVRDLKSGKKMTKATRGSLQKLESSNVPLADIFADLEAYNAAKPHMFSALEKTVRQIDVTDPSFIEHMLHIIRNGDSRSAWTLIRLLRCHTSLKISLSKSWQQIPEPSEMALVRYYAQPRGADCPDPHAALEMVHSLATSISCARNLSPCRAYSLVHWLYVYLVKHSAPVKPVIARAIYHAGIVRYRREGVRVSRAQYDYIMDFVKKYEDPEMVEALVHASQAGARYEGLDESEEDDYIYA